ncbi:MAG: hypothetical protein M3083_24655 [Actinomycetota bacterium]|nr:hypothetical protein [Actinomycetota bacterium]
MIGLIACLAVVALALLAARVLSSHGPQQAHHPKGPLMGSVDRAKATAGAADARTHQLEELLGGTTTTTS